MTVSGSSQTMDNSLNLSAMDHEDDHANGAMLDDSLNLSDSDSMVATVVVRPAMLDDSLNLSNSHQDMVPETAALDDSQNLSESH
jgi:hypothetical protein